MAKTKTKSQRTGNYKGGIPQGETTFDAVSKRLDKNLKIIGKVVQEEFKDTFYMQSIMSKKVKENFGYEHKTIGFAPDGGAWYTKNPLEGGKLIAVFEAKKQGSRGNACERWFKNALFASCLNPDVCYVTFCAGEGAKDGEVLSNKLANAGEQMFATKGSNNFTFVRQEEGFTQKEVYDIMKKTLEAL